MTTKKILLISTGGTIAGQVAKDKLDEEQLNKDFAELIKPTVFYLKNRWKIDVLVEPIQLCDVDSSDILPKQWMDMANLIYDKYDEFDAFIITHGTNTLGYTCAALSFSFANLNKPIVLTGSQVPSGMPGSDALTNLNNAMRVAVWPYQPPIEGVVAAFGSHIITGTRVKKNTEFDYDAFQSFGTGSIGRIGRIININKQNLEKHRGYLQTDLYNPALSREDLICKNDFDMRIVSLTEFPGMSPDIIINLIEKNDIKGIVFRAFGAGDVSHNLHPAFEFLKGKEIPIVVTTQAPNGNSNFQVNEPGQHLRKKELAIPAYDMSIESQTTKLGWLLAQKAKGELTYKDIGDKMITDMRGEITVLKEYIQ